MVLKSSNSCCEPVKFTVLLAASINFKFAQPWNVEIGTSWLNVGGKVILSNFAQFLNTLVPISDNAAFLSLGIKLIFIKLSHPSKTESPNTFTPTGTLNPFNAIHP